MGLTSICEPGRNASIPKTSTIIPPFVLHLTNPLTISPVSWASLTLSQALITLAFLWERINWPVASSRISIRTSTLSPTFKDGLYLNSFSDITPSDLALISIIASLSVIWTTVPSTTLLVNVSTKFSSTNFSNSLICFSSTCSIPSSKLCQSKSEILFTGVSFSFVSFFIFVAFFEDFFLATSLTTVSSGIFSVVSFFSAFLGITKNLYSKILTDLTYKF